MTASTLRAWGIEGDGIACSAPLPLLGAEGVAALREAARRLDRDFGYSRERPRRIRGVHQLAPDVCATLLAARFVDRLSEAAAERLRIHPAAHFGCSFNLSQGPEEGWADPWHLDAAAYTAVVLLSEPEPARGGQLCLFRDDPSYLWEALDRGEQAPAGKVEVVPFSHAGEVVLFQGRRVAHAVTGLRGAGPDRLTLAVGLYAPESPARGLFPGTAVPGELEASADAAERVRAEVLALLDRLRRRVRWPSEPGALARDVPELDRLRTALLDLDAQSPLGR
jgi:hypothetical protein